MTGECRGAYLFLSLYKIILVYQTAQTGLYALYQIAFAYASPFFIFYPSWSGPTGKVP